MAMIVEVLSAEDRAVRARVRADSLPLTIGRAWDNDVIVEDLYVDARHARIQRDENGNVLVEDLGSLNGLVVTRTDGRSERHARVVAGGGTEVRLGRTILRFHDPADPVPPALPDQGPPMPAAGPGATPRLLARPAWRFGAPIAASAIVALQVWLASYERNMANEVFFALLAFLIVAAIWAGVWALAARIVVGRFNFGGHFAVISAAIFAGLILQQLGGWVSYVFPGSRVWGAFDWITTLGLVAAVMAGHLALASRMSPLRRWRAGAITSAVILAFVLVAGVIDEANFSDVPEFEGVLKPVVVRWPAPDGIEGFLRSVEQARDEVDGLVVEE